MCGAEAEQHQGCGIFTIRLRHSCDPEAAPISTSSAITRPIGVNRLKKHAGAGVLVRQELSEGLRHCLDVMSHENLILRRGNGQNLRIRHALQLPVVGRKEIESGITAPTAFGGSVVEIEEAARGFLSLSPR